MHGINVELIMLGGAEEIGANSCYLNIGGTGIVIDAGLHPRRRDKLALPQVQHLEHKPVSTFILTHAHTDHVGGLPYLMKAQPQIRMLATRPTRDLVEIMLRNTIKLLKLEVGNEFSPDMLSLYDYSLLDKFSLIFEGFPYEETIPLAENTESSYGDTSPAVQATFYDAGHIIGSAGVMFQAGGAAILHTGDVQFARQSLLPGASFPKHHVDCLIMECTNGASEEERPHKEVYKDEKDRLAKFINEITNNKGSVLLPVFALGKTQEVLKILYNLMTSGKIPRLPVYTGGMSKRISKVYDRYCYAVPRVEPGFEIGDIPQISLKYDEMLSGKYFQDPSIVVISSGMLNVGSPSYTLAERWMELGNFGIGMMGYQDPSAPGYALLHSERNTEFTMAGKKYKRKCALEKFRFSAHAPRELLVEYVLTVKPKHLFLVHGEAEAAESLGATIKEHLPQTKIYIPTLGKSYVLQL